MRGKYFLILVSLAALWGTNFMLMRITVAALGPNLSALLRVALAVLTLALIMLITRQAWPWKSWRNLLFVGAAAVAFPHILYSWAALTLPASYSALISVSAVFFGAMATSMMKMEQMTVLRWLGCFAGFVGTALILQFGPIDFSAGLVQGAFFALIGAAFSGAATPFLKRAIAHIHPLALTAGMHLAAIPILLPGGVLEWEAAHFSNEVWASLFLMGVCTSGGGFWIFNHIMRHISPVAAVSSDFMTTGFGVAWAVLLFNESIDSSMLLGGSVLLIATFLVMDYNPLTRVIAIPSPILPDLYVLRPRRKPHEWLYKAIFKKRKDD